ncbi:hypothetical protein P12x_002579 [Tundrisphaera lichenicola]|uniref:hypothetical protein n=1 Tax=Tundrisphaera lichenicola TaxID=2029860 RepID=UPI003EBEC1CE
MTRYLVILLAAFACSMVSATPGADDKPKIRTWRYLGEDGHVGTISGPDGEDWTERRPADEVLSTFQFLRRTNRFTELIDKTRNFTLILYWDGESEWSVGEGWNTWHKGTWEEGPRPKPESEDLH